MIAIERLCVCPQKVNTHYYFKYKYLRHVRHMPFGYNICHRYECIFIVPTLVMHRMCMNGIEEKREKCGQEMCRRKPILFLPQIHSQM